MMHCLEVTLSVKLQWVVTTSGTQLRTIKWLSPISKQYTTVSISLSKTDKYHRTIIYLNLLAGKTFMSNSSVFKHGEKSNHSFERRRSHISRWGNTALWWWQFKRWGTTCYFSVVSRCEGNNIEFKPFYSIFVKDMLTMSFNFISAVAEVKDGSIKAQKIDHFHFSFFFLIHTWLRLTTPGFELQRRSREERGRKPERRKKKSPLSIPISSPFYH